MATIVNSNSPAVSFSHRPVPAVGPHEGALAPSFGSEGLDDGMEARTHQLSLLVEVNAALAGALDVESVLGGILSRLADRERLTPRANLSMGRALARTSAGGLWRKKWCQPARHFPRGTESRGLGGPERGGSLRSPNRKGPALPGVWRSKSDAPTPCPCKPARACWGFSRWPQPSLTASAQ